VHGVTRHTPSNAHTFAPVYTTGNVFDPLLNILAVSYIDNANLKSSLAEIFEHLLNSEGATDELTCDNMIRGLSKLDIKYDEPGDSACAQTIHIHMTKMDYYTITEHGALANANGALGAAEFENVMRMQVSYYIKTKLQRSISETETQADFSAMATLKLLVNEVECLKEALSRSQQTLSRSIQRTCASHSAGLDTPRVESLGSPRKTFHLVNEVSATAHNPKDDNISQPEMFEEEEKEQQKQGERMDCHYRIQQNHTGTERDFLRAENDCQKQQILHQQGLIATLTLAVESQAAAIHKMSKLEAAGPVLELPKVDASTTGAATAVSLANAITCLSSCDMLGADTYRMLSSKTCGVHDAELKTQVVGLALEEAVAASDSAAAVATLQQQQTATLQQDVLAALAEMGRVDEGASSVSVAVHALCLVFVSMSHVLRKAM
jgi:hypothetical protein